MKGFNPRVRVAAPARLHMGFLDLSGTLGRRFGSIGVALSEIGTRLTLQPANKLTALGPGAERAKTFVQKLCLLLGVPNNLAVNMEESIPAHVGLGSGTQLSLAIGVGLSRFYGLDLGAREIACLLDRGVRSGIGVGVFERGGFIIDGGRAEGSATPPVIAHMEVPADWRFILVFDASGQGLHGAREIEAFKALPPFPREETARLCHMVLMQALPALAEGDLAGFGHVITALQESVGDYFAVAQGGRFTSRGVARALDWLGARGAVALGQSSWGPTGFCVVDGEECAQALVRAARTKFSEQPALRFVSARAQNRGAQCHVDPAVYGVMDCGAQALLKRVMR